MHNLFGNALDFYIHLDCGNALLRARNLKVHVAEEVFETLNIGQYLEFARLLIFDKTHCDARLMGTPASISAIVEPQTEAMDEEPFDEVMSLTTLIAYGNSSSGGSTGINARSASAP